MALWNGRFEKELNEQVNDFNSSLPFDKRLYYDDITGSIAHVTMLGGCGIIPEEESGKIAEELKRILGDIESGRLPIDNSEEDIHSFVERELTQRIGDPGKKINTGRS